MNPNDLDLATMETADLEALRDTIDTILADRQQALLPEFKFEFEATNDPRKGKPYVARLFWSGGKIEREFFDMEQSYGRRNVTVTGSYTAKPGDIIEIRTGGSWKNDYRDWNLVTEDGRLVEVAHIQDSRSKLRVKRYLRGEMTAEDLLAES